MGKKESIVSNIISEEMMDKVISIIKEKAEDFEELYERKILLANEIEEKKFMAEQQLKEKKLQLKQEVYKEQRESIASEFDRLTGMLKKTDPTSDKYEKLTDNLYNLKKLLNNWGGSDYSWD